MPINYHQFSTGDAHASGPIAKLIAKHCVEQYELNIAPGPGGGIAHGSCWAGLAIPANAAFRRLGTPDPANNVGAVVAGPPAAYSATFGNSRMAAIAAAVPIPGAAVDGMAGHAERNAIRFAAVDDAPGTPYFPVANEAVLFVQLSPCPDCAHWIAGAGGGADNPFGQHFAAGGDWTLHVWYRWPYGGAGVAAMEAWNAGTRVNKLGNINFW